MIKDYLGYLSLCSKLREYQRAYYDSQTELVTNDEYDRLRKQVIAWEKANPKQALTASPAYAVGYASEETKAEGLRHSTTKLSLENALDEDEAESWICEWINRFGKNVEVIAETK